MTSQCRCFHIYNFRFIVTEHFLNPRLLHLPLGQIFLISNKQNHCVFLCIFLCLRNPSANTFKRLQTRQIKYYNCSHCSIVIGLCDCSKSLLSSCVPYLASNIFPINMAGLWGELDSDCWFFVFNEYAVYELWDEICFTDSSISNDYYFEKIVVLLIHAIKYILRNNEIYVQC
jgi:hypothetical protein